MPNIKSAEKRVQIAERNRLRNRAYTSAVKTLVKKCLVAVSAYQATPSPEAQKEVQVTISAAYSKIDKAIKRGALHKNTGARRKSQLAAVAKTAETQAFAKSS